MVNTKIIMHNSPMYQNDSFGSGLVYESETRGKTAEQVLLRIIKHHHIQVLKILHMHRDSMITTRGAGTQAEKGSCPETLPLDFMTTVIILPRLNMN